MNKTIIVQLMAGPGSGKSTICASVFSKLKWAGINCEMATEYAKDKVWEESLGVLKNQFYIFGKQIHRIKRLIGKVDVIITDSPILNCIVYDAEDNQLFKDLIVQEFNKWDNMTYFLNRVKKYNPSGRTQTEEKARHLDGVIKKMLSDFNIPFSEMDGTEATALEIAQQVLSRLK